MSDEEKTIIIDVSKSNAAWEDARRGSSAPSEYRLARYPSGNFSLQGYFTWTSATAGGGEWKTIPIVELDIDGVELEK
jgi:hypothetical protein